MSEELNILPAEYVGQRIADLRTAYKMSKDKLAKRVGISPSMQGRIESGETKAVKDDLLKEYANVFDVSTDFLLGITDFPGKKNYEIGELGLSIKAAEVLYTHKVDTDVVNRLLEDNGFPLLTKYIRSYFEQELSDVVEARHEIIRQFNAMSKGTIPLEDRKDIRDEYQIGGFDATEMDKARIQNTFMGILNRIRKGISDQTPTTQPASKDLVASMFESVTGGMPSLNIQELAKNASIDLMASVVAQWLGGNITLNEEQSAIMKEHIQGILLVVKEATEQ